MPDIPGADDRGGATPGSPGLGESATGVVASVLDYLHARIELFALEAREARGALLWRLLCTVIAAFFVLVAYAAGCVGVIGWLSKLRGWPWPLTTFGLAGAHLLVALLLLAAARQRFRRAPFGDSLRELGEDRAWLRRHRNRPKP